MDKANFTLADLAVATARRQGKTSRYHALADELTGTGTQEAQLPARKCAFDERFAIAVEKACLLPEALIAKAMTAIDLPVPKLWVEGVRPGCRLRTGCLYTKDASGIALLLVMENSVAEWHMLGWRLPEKVLLRQGRALLGQPLHMRYGDCGVEWHDGKIHRASLDNAIAIAERGPVANPRAKQHIIADIKRNYAAADFMARALVVMRSVLLVEQAQFEETPEQTAARRREFAQQREAAKRGRVAPVTCARLPYDIAAIKRLGATTKASEARVLVKMAKIAVDKSKARWDHKKGEPMKNKRGELIYNKSYTATRRVSDSYVEKQRCLTASRPVKLDLSGDYPALRPE